MKKYLLLGIILLASILRLWDLGSIPNGLHADEADTGYTAYSILKTGKDHYSDKLTPFFFRGQSAIYRAPVYSYLVIPSVALFGLNSFAVRFPSAILGVGVVMCMFFLTKKITKNEGAALWAAFLTSVNPWSIQVSRTGLEIGPALFFITFGMVLFLYGIEDRKKKYLVLFSAISFSLSIFTYHSAKIFTPLAVLLIVWYVYKQKYHFKNIFIAGFLIIFCLSYSLMLYENILSNGGKEYYNVSIFNSTRAQKGVDRGRTLTSVPLSISSIFHNKVLYYINSFEFHYFEPLSINYLFLNGESALDKGVSNHGQYYLFELPFFFVGWYLLWRKSKIFFLLLFGWFLFALIPGAITITGYYAYRDIQLLPVPIILSSLALSSFSQWLKKMKLFLFLAGIGFFIITLFVINYLNIYFFDYSVYSRDWWGYSQWKAIKYLSETDKKYTSVYIHGGEDWVVIYAFFNKLDPTIFRKAFHDRKTVNGITQTKLGKYTFGDLVGNDHQHINPKIKRNSLFLVPGDVYPAMYPKKSFRDVEGVHVIYNIMEIK